MDQCSKLSAIPDWIPIMGDDTQSPAPAKVQLIPRMYIYIYLQPPSTHKNRRNIMIYTL